MCCGLDSGEVALPYRAMFGYKDVPLNEDGVCEIVDSDEDEGVVKKPAGGSGGDGGGEGGVGGSGGGGVGAQKPDEMEEVVAAAPRAEVAEVPEAQWREMLRKCIADIETTDAELEQLEGPLVRGQDEVQKDELRIAQLKRELAKLKATFDEEMTAFQKKVADVKAGTANRVKLLAAKEAMKILQAKCEANLSIVVALNPVDKVKVPQFLLGNGIPGEPRRPEDPADPLSLLGFSKKYNDYFIEGEDKDGNAVTSGGCYVQENQLVQRHLDILKKIVNQVTRLTHTDKTTQKGEHDSVDKCHSNKVVEELNKLRHAMNMRNGKDKDGQTAQEAQEALLFKMQTEIAEELAKALAKSAKKRAAAKGSGKALEKVKCPACDGEFGNLMNHCRDNKNAACALLYIPQKKKGGGGGGAAPRPVPVPRKRKDAGKPRAKPVPRPKGAGGAARAKPVPRKRKAADGAPAAPKAKRQKKDSAGADGAAPAAAGL